ncbi:MAG: hypothetical protein WCR06_10955 [bacterium]
MLPINYLIELLLGFRLRLLAAALALRVGITHRRVQLLPGYTLECLPAQLADQTGTDLPLTPLEVQLLAPDGGRMLQRQYGSGNTILWLAAVQSSGNWRVQHPPQVCYTAQGWRIEEQGARTSAPRRAPAMRSSACSSARTTTGVWSITSTPTATIGPPRISAASCAPSWTAPSSRKSAHGH